MAWKKKNGANQESVLFWLVVRCVPRRSRSGRVGHRDFEWPSACLLETQRRSMGGRHVPLIYSSPKRHRYKRKAGLLVLSIDNGLTEYLYRGPNGFCQFARNAGITEKSIALHTRGLVPKTSPTRYIFRLILCAENVLGRNLENTFWSLTLLESVLKLVVL